jgi:indolepyruvate decarboxylase
MNQQHTISSYLIERLKDLGVRHVFGVPGDYVLGFYKEMENSTLEVINTCDELGAGFAADAYARVNGIGAVCITYCVGGLKVANSTAQAFAEKSPVVIISGAPGKSERVKHPILHHKVRDFDSQLKVFEQLTVASAVIDDPDTACAEINRVIDAAMKFKRPVYLEIPRDVISRPVTPAKTEHDKIPETDGNILKEALQEAIGIINAAEKPVILAGVEIHRFGLQKLLLELLKKTNLPVASTLLSKSVIVESHPQYLGVYEGAMGRDEVKEYVESSDCLILLGVFMSDINLGIFTDHIDQGKCISTSSEKLSIHYHSYEDVGMEDFIKGLISCETRKREILDIPNPPHPVKPQPETGKKLTVDYLFGSLNSFLDDNTIVIADPGDALFAAIDMSIHSATKFLASAYYASLGFAVPGGIGAQLANPKLRPLVLVGDGAFQMSAMELASAARFGLNPIVVVLNNEGYGTERPMIDGRFNDVHLWDYSKLTEVFKAGKGYEVKTENELEAALVDAKKQDSLTILDVHLAPDDSSLALKRLTAALKKHVK